MGNLFAPLSTLLALGYKAKHTLLAVLMAVPLAILMVANPPGWGWAALGVGVTFSLAVYYLAALVLTTDAAWQDIHRVTDLLSERDLRHGRLPELHEITATNREGLGHLGSLYRSLTQVHRNLNEIVGEASRSAGAASEAAKELAIGNVRLSQRTEEAASTLEETAAAMEQLASTVRENADSCRRASELAGGATVVARKGSEAAQKAVATMGDIDKGARRIVDIIAVIEGISFQTNILALNAAVEAARAGEQGRGFAVVAAEVRSLAQRSAAAAREIKQLIDASVANVDKGSKLVNDAGRIINEVTSGVEEVNELIGVIAVASREQSSGVEGVSRALAQLQGATEKNAELVSDAAASAVTFKEEAGQLTELVSRFRVDARGPGTALVTRGEG
ncbi:MAG: methyl-accepting chemotaxis protein [Usitatibacter sp.]